MTKPLREFWARSETAFGVVSSLPCSLAVEIVGTTGTDVIMVDRQHGFGAGDSLITLLQAARAAGAAAIVRVPSNDPAAIGAALDAGAEGVVVPIVQNRQEAEQAVAACRYPPTGNRSYGPARSALVMTGTVSEINAQVLCIPMIETIAGVDAAEDICSRPGVDGVMIGPVDLALSMGLEPRSSSPRLEEAISRVRVACRRHGVATVIGASREEVPIRVAEDYELILLGTDAALLQAGAAAALANARSVRQ